MFAGLAALATLNSLAKTADEMQSIQARIGMLPQTITDAATAFDQVAAKASEAKQSIEAYAGFYVKAGNATKSYLTNQEDVLKVVDGVAFGLAASGASAVSQSQAFFQLGQAIGSPAVQMEEMNTLIDVAPNLFDALGKAIPGANGNLKKFISTGKVTGQMLADGLMTVMPQFRDQMMAMPMTIGTAGTLIGNRYKVFINRMNRESGAVTKIADFFIKGFDRIEKALEKLVKFFGGATPTLKFFGIALAAALAPLAFKLAAGAVMFLISPLGLLMAGLLLVGLALEDVYQWMDGGESIIGRFLGDFDTVEERFSGTITTIKLLTAAVLIAGAVWATVMLANGAALAWFIGTATAGIIGFAATWVIAHAKMAVATLIAYAPILLLIAALGLALVALLWLWDNWKLIMGMIYDLATGNWKGVADGFMKMVDKIKGYWNSFKSFFGMGVSTTISTATAAGAASSASGVPTAAPGGNTTIQINQELPPGTPEETRQAAYNGTKQAMADNEMAKFARQAGQAQ